MNCIIYLLKNKINNKIYVGQTWQTLSKRWSGGYEGCHKLNRAIKLYGKENFYYEVLTFTHTKEIANYYEKFFIEKYDSIKTGYNIRFGGSDRGAYQHTNETKQKLSKSHTGKKHKEESKKKLEGNKNASGKRTNEQKETMRKSQLGKTQSEESKLAKSIAITKWWQERKGKAPITKEDKKRK